MAGRTSMLEQKAEINYFHPSFIFHHLCIQRILKVFDPEEESIRSFIVHVSTEDLLFLSIANTPLDEMLMAYEEKLRNEIHYPTISNYIVNHLQNSAEKTLAVEIIKTLQEAFIAPKDILQHDDQIMMTVLINCDLVMNALNKKLFTAAIKYFWIGKTLLTAHNTTDVPIDDWVFKFWVNNADLITDASRVPCMISSMKLVDAQNIPDPIKTSYFGTAGDPSTWRTTFVSKVDHQPTKPLKSRSVDSPDTRTLICWFVLQRLPPETELRLKKVVAKNVTKDYTGQSIAFLFLAMANNIKKSDVYKKLLNVLSNEEKVPDGSRVIELTMDHVIQPSCTYTVTYEQIVTVALLLSDLMNLWVLAGRTPDADGLYAGFMNEFFLKQPLADIITNGWRQMKSFLVELVCKPNLHLMHNYTLIGELKQYSQLSNKQNVPAVRVTENGSIIDLPLPTPYEKFAYPPKPEKTAIAPIKLQELCLYTEVNKNLYTQKGQKSAAIRAMEKFSANNYSFLTEEEYHSLLHDGSLPQGCSILDLEYTITDQELPDQIKKEGRKVADQIPQKQINRQEAVGDPGATTSGLSFDILAMSVNQAVGQDELQKLVQSGSRELMEQDEDNDLADEMIAEEEKDEALRDAQIF